VKLHLVKELYALSLRDFSDKFSTNPSTLDLMLGWAKYKTENFHEKFISPLTTKERLQIGNEVE